MRTTSRMVVSLVAVLVVSMHCGPLDEPSEGAAPVSRIRDPIVDGTVETGHEAVGALGFDVGSWGFSHFCTGTLIAPRWVLTAAHCLEQEGWPLDPRDVGFFIGTYSEDPASGTVVDCEEFYVHESYVAGDPARGVPPENDIGLVELESAASVTPIEYNDEPLVDAEGDTVVWVGFGVSDPPYGGSGTKRIGEGVLSYVLFWQLVYGNDGEIPCSGDSGGPTLMDFGGVERVVGVISTADEGCDEGGTSTRVDGYAPWIEATMEGRTVAHECVVTGGDCGPDRACLPEEDGSGFCWGSDGLDRDEACEPDWNEWVLAPCADGLICASSGATGTCMPMCFDATDCEGTEECIVPLYSNVEDVGTCRPCRDTDRDGVCRDEDCDDTDERAYPGATEVCDDRVDNDCDGQRDEDDPDCACEDVDGDGHCGDVDCDDDEPSINPGAVEVCDDGVDNDCDGHVDDLDDECAPDSDGGVDGGADGGADAGPETGPDAGNDGSVDDVVRETAGCDCGVAGISSIPFRTPGAFLPALSAIVRL